jgi:hypothetical protein
MTPLAALLLLERAHGNSFVVAPCQWRPWLAVNGATVHGHGTSTVAGEPRPLDSENVLRRFVRDGRLVSIPAQRSKRLVVLDRLAQEFEVGRRYPERTVNELLGRWHRDTAALRRYLVDEGFLDREAGEYWRAGGSVDV